jgi:hypothetical protein
MAPTRNGPERFWSRRPVRIASGVALAASVVAHATFFFPVDLRPIEIHDVEGEAAIAVEVLSLTQTEAAERSAALAANGVGETAAIAEGPAILPGDGGADANVAAPDGDDGSPASDGSGAFDGTAASDGSGALDGSAVSDGIGAGDGRDGSDGAVWAGNDAAAPDPGALIGAIQTERVLVMLVVNAEVIRKNPVGAKMGYLLRGIPQWNEFMAGTNLDPVRDTDWIVISGPSLVHTERDVVLIHYSAPDRLVDRAIAALGRRYARGGAVDAGVPGVNATLAHADRAERVILRPQPRVVAIVPPSAASRVARQLVGARVTAPIRAGDAVYLRFVSPHRALDEIPASIDELRLRVVPRVDQGADVLVDGDATDSASAASAAAELARFVRRRNDTLTSLVTHGLLDQVEITSEGSSLKIHLAVTEDQIDLLTALVGDFLGVEPDDPPAPPARPLGPPPARR